MKSFAPLPVILISLALTGVSIAALPLSSEIDAEILDSLFNKSKYDASVRPPGRDQNKTSAVAVTLQLMIRHINFLDDSKQEVNTQLTLRLSWEDPRHRYEHLFKHSPDKLAKLPDYVVIADSSSIWYPGIFIHNEKSAFIHTVLRPNVVVRIFKHGTTNFSSRITVLASCPMALHWYPFDKHDCPLSFSFYGLRDHEGTLTWVNRQSLEILAGTELPIFHVRAIYHSEGNFLERRFTGNYSTVRAHIEFERRLSYYLFTVFVPCFLLCAVSWTSFWLDIRAVDARVSLGITTILATATQLNGIAEMSPKVSYLKAVDIFSCICQIFVSAAFLEFATVSFIMRKDSKPGQGQNNINTCKAKDERWVYRKEHARPSFGNPKSKDTESPNWDPATMGMHVGMQIDKISRIAFPSLFFGFAIVYFSVCLNH